MQQTIAPISDKYFRHSEGAALRLPSGQLLLAWSRFYAEEDKDALYSDDGPANIVLAFSGDDGRTWTSPRALPLPRGRINNMQVSLLQNGPNTLLVYSKRDGGQRADKWLIESQDEGLTWSTPRQVTPGDRRYTGPNDRILRLSTGRILLPCHTAIEVPQGKHGRNELAPVMSWSDDDGKTWNMGEPLVAATKWYQGLSPLRLHEPAVIERKDGSLWMLLRSTVGHFFEAISKDGGKTWSQPEVAAIESLTAPPQMKRLSDGRLLLVWNPYNEEVREWLAGGGARELEDGGQLHVDIKRTLLAIAISRDDGKTWSPPQIIADGGSEYGYCYPAVLELGDEVLFFASKTPATITPAELVMLRFNKSKLP